eukprot:scaffold23806_cov103-Cylindrotheca_fusiformis.AAC.1
MERGKKVARLDGGHVEREGSFANSWTAILWTRSWLSVLSLRFPVPVLTRDMPLSRHSRKGAFRRLIADRPKQLMSS